MNIYVANICFDERELKMDESDGCLSEAGCQNHGSGKNGMGSPLAQVARIK